ncbi:MAG: hypothetical protein M3271_01385, partial [Actinomycetota bacterium]|nr:hypothetical protein [Actinomycetota bacterium]
HPAVDLHAVDRDDLRPELLRDAERRVLQALRARPGELPARVDDLARAGSCGAGPLAAFGFLFADGGCELLAYEHPFGVGYAVAVTR